MSGLEIKSTGEILTTYNGDTIDDAKWSMNYDGENMDVATIHNNELSIIQLDNNDLMKLFGNMNQSPQLSLEERIQRDFSKKKYPRSMKTKRVRFADNIRKSGKHSNKLIVSKSQSPKINTNSKKSKKKSVKKSSSKRRPKKKSSKKISSSIKSINYKVPSIDKTIY